MPAIRHRPRHTDKALVNKWEFFSLDEAAQLGYKAMQFKHRSETNERL